LRSNPTRRGWACCQTPTRRRRAPDLQRRSRGFPDSRRGLRLDRKPGSTFRRRVTSTRLHRSRRYQPPPALGHRQRSSSTRAGSRRRTRRRHLGTDCDETGTANRDSIDRLATLTVEDLVVGGDPLPADAGSDGRVGWSRRLGRVGSGGGRRFRCWRLWSEDGLCDRPYPALLGLPRGESRCGIQDLTSAGECARLSLHHIDQVVSHCCWRGPW
jgi:hypothetical protein